MEGIKVTIRLDWVGMTAKPPHNRVHRLPPCPGARRASRWDLMGAPDPSPGPLGKGGTLPSGMLYRDAAAIFLSHTPE